MIILGIGLIFLALISNLLYYEMRVFKGLNAEPKNIDKAYTNYLLNKRYK